MLYIQEEIIDRFLPDLKSDVIPNDTLPYLPCLTEDDRESIQCKQDREGPRAAVLVLLQRLKRRGDSFEQFLVALEHTGCKHLKELLQSSLSTAHVVTTPTIETRSRDLQVPATLNVTSPTTETTFLRKPPVRKQTVKAPTTETMSPLESPTTAHIVTSPVTETKNPLMCPVTEHTVTSPTAETTCPLESPVRQHTVTSPTAETTCPLESPVTQHTVTSPTAETTCSLESPTIEHTVTSPTAETMCPQQSPMTEHVTSPTREITCPTTAHTVTSPMTETSSPSQSDPTRRETENCEYKYDIFICYCSEDLDIAQELREVMRKEYHLKVCIDLINFMPGAAISDNICDSIRNSKAIVFLLSPEFLDKKWARWELQNALYDSLVYQQKKMFPVLLKKCSVPKELQLCHAIDLQGANNKTVRAEGWRRLAAAVRGSRGSRSTLIEKFTNLMKLN